MKMMGIKLISLVVWMANHQVLAQLRCEIGQSLQCRMNERKEMKIMIREKALQSTKPFLEVCS